MRRNVLLVLWAVTCAASSSTIWWGGFEGYSPAEKIFLPIVTIGIGSVTFLQYVFDKPLVFGLISVPADAKGFREIILFVAYFFILLPLLIAVGLYQ